MERSGAWSTVGEDKGGRLGEEKKTWGERGAEAMVGEKRKAKEERKGERMDGRRLGPKTAKEQEGGFTLLFNLFN